MKFTRTHERQLREYCALMDSDGCVPVTEWTSGKGRYTTCKALPPYVERYERRKYPDTARPHHGTPERAAYEYLLANPRRRAVLVLDREGLASDLFEAMRGREIGR